MNLKDKIVSAKILLEAMKQPWFKVYGYTYCERCSWHADINAREALEMTFEHLEGQCSRCGKQTILDYSGCKECKRVAPRGFDYLMDEGFPCCLCQNGI